MNRGKVTEEMRSKWKQQSEYITNELIWDLLNYEEEEFMINICENYINKNKDLTFHQSKWLNDICNKYQIVRSK